MLTSTLTHSKTDQISTKCQATFRGSGDTVMTKTMPWSQGVYSKAGEPHNYNPCCEYGDG